MAYGIYEAPERVERYGMLVCFAGERMTMDEALRRGLVDEKGEPAEHPAPEPPAGEAGAPAPDRMAELMAMSRDELVALAADVCAPHAKDANKTVIATAIAAAEMEA